MPFLDSAPIIHCTHVFPGSSSYDAVPEFGMLSSVKARVLCSLMSIVKVMLSSVKARVLCSLMSIVKVMRAVQAQNARVL